MTKRRWIVLIAFAFLAWVGFEIGRAGNGDVPIPRSAGPNTLIGGTLRGRRLDRRAWSLDYDTIEMSADGSTAKIAHVREGRLHREGKPDVEIKADDVTVNKISNDLFVHGPIALTEPLAGGRTRTFRTIGATYLGATRTLRLDHTATITEGTSTITVDRATVDFRTGEATLGRVEGSRP